MESFLIEKLRVQRNLLLGTNILFILVISLLTIMLYKKSQTIILVPTLDRELKIGSNSVSDEYLKLRGEQILNILFSMRENNADYIANELLKQIDTDYVPQFKEQIEKLSVDIKARKYRYWFNDIQNIEIDNHNLSVRFKGYLETYLADKQIDKKFKEYELSFVNHNGLVKLISFSEIKEDSDDKSN